MTLAAERTLVLLLWLLGTSVAALVPQVAHSHDRHAHQSTPDGQGDAAADIGSGSRASVSLQSCPFTPGQLCSCASLVAVTGGVKASVVGFARFSLARRIGTGATKFAAPRLAPTSAPLLYQARPRAPPLSS
jgi:hypothetical protein